MDIPDKIFKIFQTILRTTPPEVFQSTTSFSVLSTFESILNALGYGCNIISLVMTLVTMCWNIFKVIWKLWQGQPGQPSLEHHQD